MNFLHTFCESWKGILLYVFFLLFLGINFFYPGWHTDYGLYYCTRIMANEAAILLILFSLFSRKTLHLHVPSFFILLGLALIYLVVNAYFTFQYNSWYWDLINKCVSLALFFVILFKWDPAFIEKYHVIQTILLFAAISSVCSLIFHFAGYDAIDFRDMHITFTKIGEYEYYDDTRLTWIYLHKSTYSMMLVLLSALTLEHFSTFKHWSIPLLYLAIFGITLFYTNTMTSYAALLLVYLGFGVSRFVRSGRLNAWIIGLALVIMCLVLVCILKYIAANRDLGTLGDRIPIWKASIHMILENPHGIGSDFEKVSIYNQVNNCHSTFLNEMLRFSIPVGVMYAVIFLAMAFVSLPTDFYFFGAVWIAFLAVINMDYVLQAENLSMVFVIFYFLFFYRRIRHNALRTNAK